jgi:hypothetical protein
MINPTRRGRVLSDEESLLQEYGFIGLAGLWACFGF